MSTRPHLEREQEAWDRGENLVCGLDEVGRGAWAGPVSVGAVIVPRAPLPSGSPLEGVRDSKQLSAKRREELFPLVQVWALAWHVGHASAGECDQLGMSAALRLAAERALAGVEAQGFCPDRVLLDGPHDYLHQPHRVTTIVKGDTTSLAIAAGSIVAKVTRDRMMHEYAQAHPGYGFERNAGYSSPVHNQGLEEKGACDIHRKSWSFMHKSKHEQLSLLDDL